MTIQTILKLQALMDDKNSKIGFALARITTEQFAVIENNFDNEAKIKIHINFRFAADNKKNLVGVFSSFVFEANKKQFLIIEGGCHFAIDPASWAEMLDTQENRLIVPKGFLQHMAMLTVGTTRGILHAKTENTLFNKFHLPTIDVANMIKDDSIFKFEIKS